MLNEEILFSENVSIMLNLLHKDLYSLPGDSKSTLLFHDHNCHKLFFIYLHDYLSAEFNHPENNKSKISLFKLTMEFCRKYQNDKYFKKVVEEGELLDKFLKRERIYKKTYLPPHILDIKTNLYELISFAGNEAKHSYFRLNTLKEKLRNFFKKNNIPEFDDKNYYEHLEYFMEYVIGDRLNYHQTKVVELVGKYFLAINRMLNSKNCQRVRSARNEAMRTSVPGQMLNIEKPNNLTEVEEFYWKIKWVGGVKDERLISLIPETSPYLQLRN
jgi:hypothetical protein